MKPQVTLQRAKLLKIFLDDPETPQFGNGLVLQSGLHSGNVYFMLHGLVEAGWLAVTIENAAGMRERKANRPRKYYTLTEQGHAEATTYVCVARSGLSTTS